jgi:broad specificity phosphatase PhoE
MNPDARIKQVAKKLDQLKAASEPVEIKVIHSEDMTDEEIERKFPDELMV